MKKLYKISMLSISFYYGKTNILDILYLKLKSLNHILIGTIW